MVTVYGQPGCVPCKRTKDYLERFAVKYNFVDVTQDAQGMSRIAELGYQSVPVVEYPGGVFAGFKPMALAELV